MGALMLATTLLSFGTLSHSVGRPLLRLWGRGMLLILGVRLIVRGREHVRGRSARVIPFNHASTLDIFIVQALLPDGGVPVAKREFIRVPIVGWVVYLLDFVLLDRKNRARAAASLQRAASRITREQLSVIIAPEGTRSPTGALGQFKLGPMHLAVASHAPIVPMVIVGSARRIPHGRWSSQPGPVIVEFLSPVTTDHYTLENLHENTQALRDRFVTALARLEPEL